LFLSFPRVTENGTSRKHCCDANGNRYVIIAGTGTCPAAGVGQIGADDRLMSFGSATFTYTTNGELATRTAAGVTSTYTYDELGNLTTAVVNPTTTVEYVYDGMFQRVARKVNGAVLKRYLYRNKLAPVAELDTNNNVISRFVYGTRINVPEYMVKAGVTYRLVTDQLGSVRAVINTSTGAIVQQYNYDELGNATLAVGTADFQPFGYAGGLSDPDTKLVHFGARDYDPETGRWMQRDPILFDGGDTNLYEYCAADPVNVVDPGGLAYFSKRRLSGLPDWLAVCAPGSPADFQNTESVHEQLFFEDGQLDPNLGYFGDGKVRPDDPANLSQYKCKSKKYDDDLMRKAVRNVQPKPYNLLGDGGSGANKYNCQDWADAVRREYRRLGGQ